MREPASGDWQPLDDIVPLEVFRAEVRSWAERIGVQYGTLTVRPMKRKWASCSSRGNLTFSTDLLHQPAPFRAETIVHELVHLKVPNHGTLFRALVKGYLAEAGMMCAALSEPPGCEPQAVLRRDSAGRDGAPGPHE